jgi:uncharacterized protein YkwD
MMHRCSIVFVSLALLLSCLAHASATATRMTTIEWTDRVPGSLGSLLDSGSTQQQPTMTTMWDDYVTDTGEIIEPDDESSQVASSASVVVVDSGLTPFQQEALDSHNQYRLKHGVQELTWSPTVAQSAQAHANKCVFAHSQGSGYGENLAWGHQSIGAAIKDWYDEIHQYNYYSPGFAMGTGHFTQIVWKTTTELGCARGNCPNMNLWVCQYNPPGNYLNQFHENVPPPL